MTDVKYPNVNVDLVGEDGNAFAILGRVNAALKQAGVSQEERDLFRKEATSGDYDHLLQTVMSWVNVDSDMDDGAILDDENDSDDYGYADQKNFD